MNVFNRMLGYTNEMMVRQCEMYYEVMLVTKDVKIGRGKNSEIVKVLKHRVEPELKERIENSLAYYKNLNQIDMERESRMTFRDYQLDIIKKGSDILLHRGFLYLAMEVRTGKTLTSLGIIETLGVSNVLFITKKKAISSIEADYNLFKPSYYMKVINYESLHLVIDENDWDVVVCDEAHSMGAFPKPSNRASLVKHIVENYKARVILLSGTPTPESYSQMYHQVYGIVGNPFSEFKNFYRFCDKHVKVTEKKINGLLMRDYSKGLPSIMELMKPFTINYTQQEAGFASKTTEEVLLVDMKESTYRLINRLKKDLVVEGKEELILADTPVKLMTKVHQLCSGTIKFESGNSMVVDSSKALFIKDRFKDNKIGIFYKFKEELNALMEVFGDSLTTELSVFEDTDKSIALQIVSGREGISLRKADYLVYYNIDFSATSYWQSKDRMTTKDRLQNNIYWVFSRGGIESDIYKAVTKKKDYTVSHFKKDFYS